MRNTMFIKRTRRYLAVLTSLAVGAVAVSGIGSHSTGLAGYSSGADSSISECGRDRADVTSEEAYWFMEGGTAAFSSSVMARPASYSLDTTTLYLDRDGVDIPEGNWWGISGDVSNAEVAGVDDYRGPDITTLNLDRDGADILPD